METGKYQNLRTCAVTGQAYEAGDYVIKASFGTYIVKASVNYTPELRKETEAKLNLVPAATEFRQSKRNVANFDPPPTEGGA